ncbi:MAG: hypothetical protein IJ991_11095 [Thermoguttaceae bacterium]|nr:hypothetical protein [Thermoguttaceae bacterium]
MPRLSSLRPLRSLASSGLVLSACLFGAGVASFAQPPSSSYPSSDYGGYGQQDPNALQNVPSGIKRSDVSSVVPLQALLYDDVTAVARVNFAKVDYVGLNEFVETVVDKGVGSLKSGDRYRDQLRDWQKGDLKAAVKSFLVEAQNIASKKFFANKIDEAYVLVYDLDGSDATVALAFPTDGLSDADVKILVDYIGSWEENKPIATFNRFGFVVAVTTHRNAVSVNVKEIENGYRNRALTEGTQGQGAGNYGGAANYASSGYAGYGSQNANGLPDNLQREMTAEIKAAREDARTESIKKCGAAIKARFQKPAEAGSPVFDALKQTDGAAIAIVLASNDLSSLKEKLAPAKTETPESVLAGSFADADSDAKETPALVQFIDKVDEYEGLAGFQTLTLAASLVGSPKLAVVASFDAPEKAKASADAVNGALTAGKLTAPVLLAEQMKTSGDLKPLIDVLFDALKPQIAGSKVAVVLDLNVFKENPTALLPLFGGVESKTADEQEADVWDAVDDATEEEAPAEEAAPAEETTVEEVDPFAEEAAPAEETTDEEVEEDDPFGSDEEDPFA